MSRFDKDQGVGKTLHDWWSRLDEHRGDRAALRRADTLTAVTLTPAYQRIYTRLGPGQWNPSERDRLAAIVGLLAHVKSDSGQSLPEAMSQRAEGTDRNAVSELRFRRLLDAPDLEALFTGLRRVLPLVQHGVDPVSLANDVFHWGDSVKKRWAYAYAWPQAAA